MVWIEIIDEADADGELAAAFDESRDPTYGKVDKILAVHSLHVGGMRAHEQLYRAVMAGTKTLRKVEREMIALVVSQANECHY